MQIERQLRELQLQRQQQQQSVASMGMQQAEQQQGLGAAVKSAREQEDGQEVVELLSSSEEERASAEVRGCCVALSLLPLFWLMSPACFLLCFICLRACLPADLGGRLRVRGGGAGGVRSQSAAGADWAS